MKGTRLASDSLAIPLCQQSFFFFEESFGANVACIYVNFEEIYHHIIEFHECI